MECVFVYIIPYIQLCLVGLLSWEQRLAKDTYWERNDRPGICRQQLFMWS